MAAPIIKTRALTKRFGAFTAVDALSIEVAAGSIFAFLGANGSGKSTTIRMLIGVLTRKTLVREVVAAGLDPTAVELREIAEPPIFTLDAGLALDQAFHMLEERDLERVPVVEENGRLVGVLSRAVVRRRLAEDEPPAPDPDPGSLVL